LRNKSFISSGLWLAAVVARAAGPETDPPDGTVWPNQASRANGDRWIVENHDRLRQMRPRVLIVNFSNLARREKTDRLVAGIIDAIAEGSRYHGNTNPNAPAFLKYEVFKLVDLRDESTNVLSAKTPLKPGRTNGFNVNYNAFFSDQFVGYFGAVDPANRSRYLRLDELVARGYVHELWMVAEGVKGFGAFESVELKPKYDEQFRPLPGRFVQAGNGGDPDQKWTGRSIRIGFINASRGVGCFMESLSHSMEGMATSGAIPYFTKYFKEFAGYDLRTRWNLPFNSFYALKYDGRKIEYPDEHTTIIRPGDGREITLTNYFVIGGNAHWPPNGRGHYDLDNGNAVLSTMEDWRIGSGPGGSDLKKPFTNEAFARYRGLAPDCMGAWLVYWRQSFPGLDNLQKEDDGKPMKNWWPFLFY
jgi:hypothetical protein